MPQTVLVKTPRKQTYAQAISDFAFALRQAGLTQAGVDRILIVPIHDLRDRFLAHCLPLHSAHQRTATKEAIERLYGALNLHQVAARVKGGILNVVV